MNERKLKKFSQKRVVASRFVGTEDGEDMVRLCLRVQRRSARAFCDAVRAGRDDVLAHGNWGRSRFDQARNVMFDVLSNAPRGSRIVAHRFRAWLESQGIPAPSERTIRWWQREVFGVRCRRRRQRKKRVGK